jgi:hypothetical protein
LFIFREAGTQVSPVTMSHPSLRTTAPPCLLLGIKDSLKEDDRFLLWAFVLGIFTFALRLLLLASDGEGFFGVGGFWKGKELLKGKDC